MDFYWRLFNYNRLWFKANGSLITQFGFFSDKRYLPVFFLRFFFYACTCIKAIGKGGIL